jgi:hypothetical protein
LGLISQPLQVNWKAYKRRFQDFLVGGQQSLAAGLSPKNRWSKSSVLSTIGMGGEIGGKIKAHGNIFIKQYNLINSKGRIKGI